jgi:hypothetical protein
MVLIPLIPRALLRGSSLRSYPVFLVSRHLIGLERDFPYLLHQFTLPPPFLPVNAVCSHTRINLPISCRAGILSWMTSWVQKS